jgi:predicted Ser/Thr protein kinase
MPDLSRPVDRYEILRELGRGGMAVVYLARQLDLNRLVALKELGALRSSDPSFAGRFLQEARVAGALTHANIVTVYDYFERDGVPYIGMEYMERGSLRPYVGRMSPAQIGGVLEGLLAGLSQAEQQGIVHRDLKPENLLVTSDGRVKITDFGIAKARNKLVAGTFLTQTGTTVGTPNYIAPEQAMGLEVGPSTDLYSVGVMAFEFLVGRPPFADTTEPMGIVLRHINEQIPRVTDLVPSTDPLIADWVEHMVAKEPSDRPQSASEAWDSLEEGLLAVLGARWRRGAILLEPGEQPILAPRESAAAPTSSRTTLPLSDGWGARTAMPRTQLQDAGAAAPSTRRTRKWPLVIAGLAVAGIIAAAAGAIGGRSSGNAPAAAAATTAPLTSTDLTAPTNTASQTPKAASDAGIDATNLADAAKTARDLASQYQQTATQIAQLAVSSSHKDKRARLVDALQQAAAAYRAVARAADKGDATAYTSALVVAGEKRQAVQQALDDFGGDGSVQATGDQTSSDSSNGSDASDECSGDSNSDDPSDDSCEP